MDCVKRSIGFEFAFIVATCGVVMGLVFVLKGGGGGGGHVVW